MMVWNWFKITWAGSGLWLAWIIVGSLGSALLLTAFPWLWQFVIDEVQGEVNTYRILQLSGWMALVTVSQFILYMALQGARSGMNAKIQWAARQRVFEHLSEMDGAFYRRWSSGDLVTRLYDDAGEKIAWFLCSGIFRAFEAALILLVCLTTMVVVDPWLTLWVVLPLPVLIALQATAQGALGRRYREVQQSISGINDELTLTFEGIRIVQACRLQAEAERRFTARAERQFHAEIRSTAIDQIVRLMYGFGWQSAIVALLVAGGAALVEERITMGQFIAFEGLLMTLVWPMFDFGMFVSKYQQTKVALTRLQEIVATPAPERSEGTAHAQEAGIALDHVHLGTDSAELLHDVSLSVAPSGFVAVVGAVGSGKSLLMAALAGAWRPGSGSVTLGGVAVDTLDEAHWRQSVALVPQDPVLLSASLRENVLLGREVEPQTLDRALDISRLAQDLPSLPGGLDTEVGERGVTLSGGQQQRVALARALVGLPRVLLLDDATAALDADTESAFWERLAEELPDITRVVVTHRVATLEQADQILVLESGRVAQQGRHEELIAQPGEYQRIYGQMAARAQLA